MNFTNLLEHEKLSFKSIGSTLSIDQAQGIVECFAAGIGNKDSVGDVILPGAFVKSLKRRKPRVVWGHDWNQPVGKVLEAYEVGPNDPRLPQKMKDAGIGGLFVKMQFNLNSKKGLDAFNDVMFFGEEQEWSIGYKTLDGSYDSKSKANMLKEIELYEVSPVLHGANQLTSTISIKSAEDDTDDVLVGLKMLKDFSDKNPNWKCPTKDDADDIESKRAFSSEERGHLANTGAALPDGSFPIKNRSDLENAIQAFGRAKNRSAAKAHIKKRAASLGLSSLLPDSWKSLDEELEEKVVLPTEGNRQGNEAALLAYWTPIMQVAGGFRKCIATLADHPELGPLPNLCAWLHHETTGRWPAEPGDIGGKSDTNPAVGPVAELARALATEFGGEILVEKTENNEVIWNDGTDDFKVKYLIDDGDFIFGKKAKMPKEHDEECNCGGDCCSVKTLDTKVGRTVSSTNMTKLNEALRLLTEIIHSGLVEQTPSNAVSIDMPSNALKQALDVVNNYHNGTSEISEDGNIRIEVKSDKHLAALTKVTDAFGVTKESI